MRRHRIFRTASRAALSVAMLLVVSFGGCDADPMPSPGLVNRLKLIVSNSHATRPGGPLDLIGIIGLKMAAPGSGIVVVHSQFNGSTEASVSADGTFAALLPGASGDQLTLTFKQTETGPESEPITVTVPVEAQAAGGAADASPGTPSTSSGNGAVMSGMPEILALAPDRQGKSEVKGSGLMAGQDAVIGNTRTGEVIEPTVATDGTVDTTIGAKANDSLVIVIRDPTTGLTSGSATLSVPAM